MSNKKKGLLTAVLSAVILLISASAAFAHIDVTLKDSTGATVTGTTPYSTKMTCGGCHFDCTTGLYSEDKATWCGTPAHPAQRDCSTLECPDYASYETSDSSHVQGYPGTDGKITFSTTTTKSPQHGASTGYHSQHGRNEGLTAAQRTIWGAPAFISSPGMFGRYCMPSNRQLVRKDYDPTNGGGLREMEMGVSNWSKSCGVCHAGGGQMEYDRDMNPYSATSATGDRYTYLIPTASSSGAPVNGGIVDISTLTGNDKDRQLMGDNKAEVDCLLCHMSDIRPSAAYYKNTLNCGPNMVGPADNPNCGNQKVVFMDMNTGTPTMMPDNRFTFTIGDFYDSFNRNIAVSYGYLKQAASAGLGAGIDLATGSISGMPSSLPGSKIASVPSSGNCAQCHARNESDNIGLPGEAQVFGGMIAGYGNFVRLTPAGEAFDFDKVDAGGACTADCTNATGWFEFGCKTGMGKRSQKTGYGSSDRYGNGFCLICDSQNQWSNPQSFCALPSVQAACITKTEIPTLISDGSPMTLVDMTAQGPMPKLIPNKMPDVDVHDKNGVACASCHYAMSGTIPERTVSGAGQIYTYPSTSFVKMDHNLAKGYSMLEKGGDRFEGTVSCPSCHIAGENNHPNAAALGAPIAGHAGFPAIHFDKIDCRTCHIPAIYAMPGRLMFRDWTAGAYRQTEGSNGNANHFEFAMSLLEGSMTPIETTPMWITTPEGTKITPMQTNLLPIWTGSVQMASNDLVSWSPAKTRDITAAAAVVAAANTGLGIRINGTNDHPPFQGFQLTDPLKIGTKEKIDLMATELASARTGVVASHSAVRDARLNLFPLFYDTSHGVLEKKWALGAPERGGCANCHSTSARNPMTGAPLDPATFSDSSVGFFDGNKELLQNAMMMMANYDCDNPYVFTMMTTGQTSTLYTPTCIETTPIEQGGTGLCDGTAKGTTSTGAQNGTMGLCKQTIGGALAQQMGMPADPMMRMDGVEFMQMMAIREGGSAPHAGSPNGCNPMMQIFGLPTGCTGAEIYSRGEIHTYFAKALEQSFFNPTVGGNWTNPVTGSTEAVPSTLGRVFGVSAQIKKNPSNPAHVNVFDIGATCRNPLTGATGPCSEAMPGMTNLVNTAVTAKQLLGYSDADNAKLTSFSTMQTTDACTACHAHTHTAHVVTHTDNATCASCHATSGGTPHRSIPSMSCQTCHTDKSMSGMNHNTGAGTPSDCTSCHAPGQVPTIDNTCKKCHGVTAPFQSDGTLSARAAIIHDGAPNPNRAGFSWAVDGVASFKVNFTSNSTCGTNDCTYGWAYGDGATSTFTTSTISSHTYSTATPTYAATLTVRSASGAADVTATSVVTPKFNSLENPVTMPTATPSPLNVSGLTVSFDSVVSGGTGTISQRITWGDGQVSTYTGANVPVTHTYAAARTYTIIRYAIDSGVGGAGRTQVTSSFQVTTLPMTITGLVTRANGTTPIASVSMALRLPSGQAIKLAITSSSGTYTFNNVAPGTYNVTAAKTGYVFTPSSKTLTSISTSQTVTFRSSNL